MVGPDAYEAIMLGDLKLENGNILVGSHVGFAHWGLPVGCDEPIVVLPSYYSGSAKSYAPWIGKAGLFDPAQCCIIAFDQFGAGKSSKPSDEPQKEWPAPSLADCVRAQKRALELLGVDRIDLIAGWSMGGMQVFSWCEQFPDFVASALAVCATPAPSAVNRVFLEGIRAVLVGGLKPSEVGALDKLPRSELVRRLCAFGAVYAGWAYSDEFFLSEAYRAFGYESCEAVVEGWAADHEKMDAADLAAQLDAWLSARAPVLEHAGESAVVRMVAMPGSTDRYFLSGTLGEARRAFPSLRVAEIASDLGHIAGRPGIRANETNQIKRQVDCLLAESLLNGLSQARGAPQIDGVSSPR